jgi:hypothetical protein
MMDENEELIILNPPVLDTTNMPSAAEINNTVGSD